MYENERNTEIVFLFFIASAMEGTVFFYGDSIASAVSGNAAAFCQIFHYFTVMNFVQTIENIVDNQ